MRMECLTAPGGRRLRCTGHAVRALLVAFATTAVFLASGAVSAAGAAEPHTVSVSAWHLTDGTDARGTLVVRPWELLLTDGRSVSSKAWGPAYESTRYVEYELPAVVPSGTIVTTVTLSHIYANASDTSTVAKVAVWDGAAWNEHALSPAEGTAWVADSVLLAELDAPAKVNGAKLRFFAANAGGAATLTDKLVLTVATNRGVFEVAPDRVDDRSDGLPTDRSFDLVADDGRTYQVRSAWPVGDFQQDRYVEFSLGDVLAPGSRVDSVRIDVSRLNQKYRMSLQARLDVFDGTSWTTHPLSPSSDTSLVSDTVFASEIDDYGKLERMLVRFLASAPTGLTGKTRHDKLTVTVTYRPPAWSFASGAAALGNPAGYPITSALYGGSNDGRVRSLGYGSGNLRWELPTGGPVQNQTVVRVNGQVRVFVGSQDGYLYAADDHGCQLWRAAVAGDYDPGTGSFSAPGPNDHLQGGVAYRAGVRIGGSLVKNALFVGTYNTQASDNAFYAIDASDGSVLWRDGRPGADFISSYPAVDYARGLVVYTTWGGRVLATETSGTAAWERALGSPIAGSPTVYSGLVLVGTSDGRLHMLSLADGSTQRVVQPAAGPYVMGTPWPGAVTYISSSKGSVYAIETSSGAVLAEGTALDGPRLPVVCDSNVYVGTNAGLYVLDRETLAVVGVYRVGYAVASPAVDVASSRLFFSDSTGRYYGVEMAEAHAAAPPRASFAVAARARAPAGRAPALPHAADDVEKKDEAEGDGSKRGAGLEKDLGHVAASSAGRRTGRLVLRADRTEMVVALDGAVSRVAGLPLSLRLCSPDGGVYARMDSAVVPRGGGKPIIVWRVPLAGTWAAGLPGTWTAVGAAGGKVLQPGSQTVW